VGVVVVEPTKRLRGRLQGSVRGSLASSTRKFVRGLLAGSSRGRRFIFTRYARTNHWRGAHSVSGPGSSLGQTAVLRAELPGLFRRHGIRSLVDVPCGDGHWFGQVDHGLDHYVGVDIVAELVRDRADGAPGSEEFLCRDILSDPLPTADAIMCRDLLVHLSERQIFVALRNMKSSGSRLLLTTHFPTRQNRDIATGGWRPLNLEASPFGFPPPIDAIVEGIPAPFEDKTLAVWRFEDLEL
jgi:SAM-dependent methyltransferase